MTAPRVDIDIRSKRLPGGSVLFANFHLAIAPGEVVAVVGTSGVGKSSLLRLIAGIDQHYDGSIRADGIPAHLAPAPGVMFQDPRLLPWLEILENLRLVAPALGRQVAEDRLSQLGLGDCLGLYPNRLSLGMQRRVALARAMVVPRALILLDEPFASLDRDRSLAVQNWLAGELAGTESTVIFATHDLAEAARLADRVVVLTGRPVAARELTRIDLHRANRNVEETDQLARQLSEEMGAAHV